MLEVADHCKFNSDVSSKEGSGPSLVSDEIHQRLGVHRFACLMTTPHLSRAPCVPLLGPQNRESYYFTLPFQSAGESCWHSLQKALCPAAFQPTCPSRDQATTSLLSGSLASDPFPGLGPGFPQPAAQRCSSHHRQSHPVTPDLPRSLSRLLESPVHFLRNLP